MEVISRTIEVKGLKVVVDDFNKLEDAVKKIDTLISNSAFGTAQFEQLIKLMNALTPATKGAGSGFGGLTTAAKGASDQMQTLTQRASALKKEISQLEQKNLDGFASPGDAAQIKSLRTELAQILAVQTQSRTEQRKLTNEFIAGGKAGAGAYKQASTELNLLRTRFKDLSVEQSKSTKVSRAERKELKELGKEVNRLDTELKEIDANAGQFQRNVGNYSEAFKGFGTTLLASFGIVGGANLVVNGIKDAIKNIGQFDEQVADLQKVTGLAKEEASDLAKELFEIDTRTSVSSLIDLATAAGRLNLDPTEIKDFVEVTDQVFVSLGDSLDGTAEEIGLTLGKIGSNFNLDEEYGISDSINRVGSVLNELGANSKAQEQPIIDFTNRLAGVASQANISLPDVAALGALFNETGQSGEVAATTLAKLLPALAANQEKFAEIAGVSGPEFKKALEEDAVGALRLVAQGAQSNEEGLVGLNEVLGSFGIESGRAAGIVGVLANETQRWGELQEIANTGLQEGTSIADEFNIKNDTLTANIDKLGNSWEKFTLSVADGSGFLGNALKNVTGLFSDILDNAALLERNTGRLGRAEERGTVQDVGIFTSGGTKADIIRELDEREKLFEDAIKKQIVSQEQLNGLIADEARQQTAIDFYQDLGFTQEEATQKTNVLIKSIEKSFKSVEEEGKVESETAARKTDSAEKQSAATKKKVEANKAEAGSVSDLTSKISALRKKLKDEDLGETELVKVMNDIISNDAKLKEVNDRIEKIKRNLAGVGEVGTIAPLTTLDVPTAVESISGQSFLGDEGFGESELIGQDADRINQKLVESAAKSGQAAGEAFVENQRAALEQALNDRQQILEAASFGLDALSEGLNAFGNIQDVNDDNRIKSIEEKYDRELELAAGNAAEIEEIERKKDEEIEKIQREQFERTKKLQIAQAAIAGAQAVLSTLASAPGFTDIATFGILRAAQVALTIGITAAQIAAISKTTFAEGGYIDSQGRIIGASHKDGGVDININGRQVNAEGGEKLMRFDDGSQAIITKGASPSFGLLSDVERSSLAPMSKKLIASMVNSKGGGIDFAKLPNKSKNGKYFAEDGGIFSPRMQTPFFRTQTTEISAENIQKIANAVEMAADRGTERGSNRGISTASERAVKLSNLKSTSRV